MIDGQDGILGLSADQSCVQAHPNAFKQFFTICQRMVSQVSRVQVTAFHWHLA